MAPPIVERIGAPRPPGVDVIAPAPGKVMPAPPINPPAVRPAPGVSNDIDPAVQARVAAATRQEVGTPDPLKGGAQQDNSHRDWTLRQAAPAVEEPPREPLTQMLIEHVHSMWQASAKAVEIWWQQYSQAQNPSQQQQMQQTRNIDPSAVPGALAKEVLTYSPSEIKKAGQTESSSRSDSTA